MPGYDGTGPFGAGPGTGWGMGPCGAGRRRGGGRVWGRRFGRGAWGFGRGAWGFGRFGPEPRWGYGPGWWGPFGYGKAVASGAPPDEAQALRDEEAYLKSQLEAVQQRLSELEGSQP
ncbi:MAG: DUF5320 domain-containing protein [Desulfobaccales bacterium]